MGLFGGSWRTHEEEPLGQEAFGGREVRCEGAHLDWRRVSCYNCISCGSMLLGGVFNGLINNWKTLVAYQH